MKRINQSISFLYVLLLLFTTNVLNCPVKAEADKQQSSRIKADEEAKLFVLKCAGCHTIGGGDLTGPDLSKAAKAQHSDLIKSIFRMQEQVGPLTKDEIESLATFLQSKDPIPRIKNETERLAKLAEAKLDPPDIKIGRELFLGKKHLHNGGTSCIACHNVGELRGWGGGKLGPDLSNVYKKFGRNNLISGIESSNWKVMKDVYREHPISKQEAVHLVAFLKSINGKSQHSKSSFHIVGLVGCAFLYILLLFFYRNRLKGVRKNLKRK